LSSGSLGKIAYVRPVVKERAANNTVDLLGSTSARRIEERFWMPMGGDSFDTGSSPSALDAFGLTVKCFLLVDPDIAVLLDNGILSLIS
jgi:hypothetical protein